MYTLESEDVQAMAIYEIGRKLNGSEINAVRLMIDVLISNELPALMRDTFPRDEE
jgi:hypothetical protein